MVRSQFSAAYREQATTRHASHIFASPDAVHHRSVQQTYTGGHWGALWGGVSQPSRGCMIYSGHNVVVRRCANVSWLPNLDRITSSGSATTESTALSWVQKRGEKVGKKYEKKNWEGPDGRPSALGSIRTTIGLAVQLLREQRQFRKNGRGMIRTWIL